MASSPPRFLDEVRASARLAAPLAAGHLSHGLVGFVDTVIAGHHGTTTLAAVAVGTASPAGHGLVVNATPLGMFPGNGAPVVLQDLERSMFVGDVVTAKADTPIIAAAI